MPAHSSSGQRPEAYFARLLAALAIAHDGELRIKGADVDAIDKEVVLVKDWDRDTQEVVIRVGTRFNEVYRVSPEAGTSQQREVKPWTTDQQEKPPVSSAAPDNSKLAALEKELTKRRVVRLLELERREAQRREAELYGRAGVPPNS